MDIDDDFDLNEEELLRQLLDVEEDYFQSELREACEDGVKGPRDGLLGGCGTGAIPIPIDHAPMSEHGQLFNLTSTSSGSASGGSAAGMSYSSSAPSNFPLLARPRLLSPLPLPPGSHHALPSTPPSHPSPSTSSGSKTTTSTPTITRGAGGFRQRSNTGGSLGGRRKSPAESKEDRLEKSRQSARECRQRKKLRYEYLQDLVNKREKAVFKLREEMNLYLEWARSIQETGQIPEGLLNLYQEQKIKKEDQMQSSDNVNGGQPMDM
ncbi:unnamed protein product [Cyprideis torosa]|uniref:Uncharacterized protein n=1 Tax=Cyprideis torosa TaxID=163714 RepID=A0A7R8W4R2_9CRUS|nr:unnamed protein product [Cyprideis torosa]CAG0880073.1 unnamed protein product [Cyprideis torosa]